MAGKGERLPTKCTTTGWNVNPPTQYVLATGQRYYGGGGDDQGMSRKVID